MYARDFTFVNVEKSRDRDLFNLITSNQLVSIFFLTKKNIVGNQQFLNYKRQKMKYFLILNTNNKI